jgi:hypothetical protein
MVLPGPVRAARMIKEASKTNGDVAIRMLSPAVLEPEVGFEPTTFRLRVGSSSQCVSDLSCYGRGNDQENDQADPRETRQTMTA